MSGVSNLVSIVLMVTLVFPGCERSATEAEGAPRGAEALRAPEAQRGPSHEDLACRSGFRENDEGRCVDIDECALSSPPCHSDATCLNTQGGFRCACLPGFVGDGLLCEAMDEGAESRLIPPEPERALQGESGALSPSSQPAPLCRLAGHKGESVTCALRLARQSVEHLPATGMDLRLGWQGAKLALEQLVSAYCVGGTCWPVDALVCDEAGSGCVPQALITGHSLILVPKDLAQISDWLSITLVHPSSVDTPISQAALGASGEPDDNDLVLSLRFRLLEDVPPIEPLPIRLDSVNLDRVDRSLKSSLVEGEGGSFILSGGAR